MRSISSSSSMRSARRLRIAWYGMTLDAPKIATLVRFDNTLLREEDSER